MRTPDIYAPARIRCAEEGLLSADGGTKNKVYYLKERKE